MGCEETNATPHNFLKPRESERKGPKEDGGFEYICASKGEERNQCNTGVK